MGDLAHKKIFPGLYHRFGMARVRDSMPPAELHVLALNFVDDTLLLKKGNLAEKCSRFALLFEMTCLCSKC